MRVFSVCMMLAVNCRSGKTSTSHLISAKRVHLSTGQPATLGLVSSFLLGLPSYSSRGLLAEIRLPKLEWGWNFFLIGICIMHTLIARERVIPLWVQPERHSPISTHITVPIYTIRYRRLQQHRTIHNLAFTHARRFAFVHSGYITHVKGPALKNDRP